MNGSSQPLTRTLKYLLPRSPLCTIAHYEALLYRCSTTKSLSTTKQVHAPILRIQLLHHCDSTHFLSLLTASYALCSQTSLARKVFDELSFRTLFSYKSMIKIYTQTGAPHNALKLFDEMLHSSQQMPDRGCLKCILGEFIVGDVYEMWR
ncbi:unnamed protein product [Cuscuta europaea]|uniref:Pentatricopeptide repeat-containing protein n=1 Tax=Cuscuta europaea TaxID=41803 RepID=A0A9P0YX07_CUSEU|nr:unnamed protein product [Cuscuta europaea]